MSPTPQYEGRPLPRPDDEIVDQGFAFDLETLSRRRLLHGFGLGAATALLAACGGTGSSTSSATSSSTATSTSSTSTGEIPDETAGPYPGDGSNGPDVLEQSGVVRSDITSSFGSASGKATGVPMTLTLTVTDMKTNAAYAGVAVYVWHCNAQGEYSMYSEGITKENYLRGVQIADDKGQVTFTSIVPGCYSGRWPHIHFEVYPDQASITDSTKAIATSQVAVPQATAEKVYATSEYSGSSENLAQVTLASDNVFGDDSGASQLATVTGDVDKGFTFTLDVRIDPDTEPTGGAAPGGSDGAPSGAPPSGAPSGPPPGTSTGTSSTS